MGIISMFPVFPKVESSTGHSADKLRCPFRQERERGADFLFHTLYFRRQRPAMTPGDNLIKGC